ncbi:hypothetical protein SADUNF_Sadunf16G0222700 [Salix dunnii]|uniref:Pentatricopeptide repeat-containing protein n=1 Tax=Salix dunnii TaxID=1413687 RepID=A0A835JB24_9ROSI|nr:hypothetical protein SADUNF_Sadunf16G0222700 [Salix dunnii]
MSCLHLRYNIVLSSFLWKSCSALFDLDSEKQSHQQVLVFGFESDLFVPSALIDMDSKCGKLSDARILIDGIPYRNIVAWTSLIAGNVQNDNSHEALMVFKEFLLNRVKEMVRRLQLLVDSVAMVSVLSACSRVSSKAVSEGVHEVVMKVGLDKVMGVESTLLDAYIKCGEMNFPGKVFDEMAKKNAVSWDFYGDVHAQNGLSMDAFEVFHGMLKGGGGKDNEVRKLMQMGNQAAPLQITLTVAIDHEKTNTWLKYKNK